MWAPTQTGKVESWAPFTPDPTGLQDPGGLQSTARKGIQSRPGPITRGGGELLWAPTQSGKVVRWGPFNI